MAYGGTEMITKHLQALNKSELKEILDLATVDIKVNRVAFKRRTSLREVIEIALISLLILQRTQKAPSARQCQTEPRKIVSKVIIPREDDFRPVSLLGFVGSVSDFRQYLKSQKTFLKAGIILP
jgi:hypothetical protein